MRELSQDQPSQTITIAFKSFSMTLRYAHLSPMHLQTAVESLDGLTPDLTVLDQMTHKMAQNAKPSERLSRKLPSNRIPCTRP